MTGYGDSITENEQESQELFIWRVWDNKSQRFISSNKGSVWNSEYGANYFRKYRENRYQKWYPLGTLEVRKYRLVLDKT